MTDLESAKVMVNKSTIGSLKTEATVSLLVCESSDTFYNGLDSTDWISVSALLRSKSSKRSCEIVLLEFAIPS